MRRRWREESSSLCGLSGAVRWLEASGGQAAERRLPPEWFRTELTGMAALVVGSSAAFSLLRRLAFGLRVAAPPQRRQPRRRGHVFRQQDEFFDDRGNAGEELGTDRRQAVDERLQIAEVADVVGEEIAGLLAEGLGDANEILDVQPPLIGLQPRELRGGDSDAPGHLGLEPAFRFAELPEDAAVHDESSMHAP